MYTLYKDINTPLCLIDNKLKIHPLKRQPLPEGVRNAFGLMINQVLRDDSSKAASLRCVDLEGNKAITLGELANNAVTTKNIDFLNPSHLKRIDRYRRAGLSEKLIAKELKTNEKMLYRNYPRRRSVSTSSTGRNL